MCIIYYFTFYGIYQKHFTRTESFFYYDFGRINIQNTNLGRKN